MNELPSNELPAIVVDGHDDKWPEIVRALLENQDKIQPVEITIPLEGEIKRESFFATITKENNEVYLVFQEFSAPYIFNVFYKTAHPSKQRLEGLSFRIPVTDIFNKSGW